MSNIYLEKIALTIEDTRSARVGGLKAGRKIERKGEAVGAGIGGVIGAGVGYHGIGKKMLRDPALIRTLAANRVTPRKLKLGIAGVSGAIGALSGVGFGNSAVVDAAQKAKNKEHTRRINQGLSKQAAVTESQVRSRQNRNDALSGLAGMGGLAAGGAGGVTAIAGKGIHNGLKETGGYTAMKNSLKNAYQQTKRKNANKSLGKGITLMGRGGEVALGTGSREEIARGTGNAMGKALRKRGLVGALAGGILGSTLASRAVNKRTDASDVNYYQKLSKRNG